MQLNPVGSQARLDLAEYYIEAPAIHGRRDGQGAGTGGCYGAFRPRSLALDPRAHGAAQHKDFDEAEAEFKAAIATAKNPASYWINLASFYQSRGRMPEMEEGDHRRRWHSPGDRNGVLYDAAGVLNRAGRNLPGAVQYLREYLARGNFDEDAPAFRAHFLMGQILEKLQRRSEALRNIGRR